MTDKVTIDGKEYSTKNIRRKYGKIKFATVRGSERQSYQIY